MALIEFTDELKTGIDDMDEEHITLINLFNKVYSLMKEGKKDTAKEIFIKELKEYVDTHLSNEEKFMESINYPELEKHKKLHNTFRKVVYNLEAKIENGDLLAFRNALFNSWGWIHTHIKTTDKKYGEYYKKINQ